MLALVALASCQTYEPRQLAPAEHRAAWHARSVEDAPIQEPGAFDPQDGLTLSEGELLALVFHPDLRLARLRALKAAAAAEHAGLWSDPELSIDVLHITRSVPDPWIVTPGLAFSVPVSGRLAAEQGLATTAQRAAEARVSEAEWSVQHRVRAAWAEWSAAQLRMEETERLIGALQELALTAAGLARAGEILSTEAGLFTVERAQQSNQLRRLRGDVAENEQKLKAALGLAPEAPVEFIPVLAPGSVATVTPESIAERNPTLARRQVEYDVAEEALRLEVEKQLGDLSLGPLFESDEGQSRVGFLGAFPIPLFNRNRQNIAEARVGRELARAAYETEYEQLAGRLAAVRARASALAEQRFDLEEVLMPLVERQVEDALGLARLGEGTSLVLLESMRRAHETKLDLIESRLAEAVASAELEHLIGPRAPQVPHVPQGTQAPPETP